MITEADENFRIFTLSFTATATGFFGICASFYVTTLIPGFSHDRRRLNPNWIWNNV